MFETLVGHCVVGLIGTSTSSSSSSSVGSSDVGSADIVVVIVDSRDAMPQKNGTMSNQKIVGEVN